MAVSFGGDAESFMDAPVMQNKGLAETMAGGGGSFFAQLLDLVGIHRQVAKTPKGPTEAVPGGSPAPIAVPSVPQVLTDVAGMLNQPTQTAITPTDSNAPMSDWGSRWLESMRPLTTVDPNSVKM